MEGVSHGDHFVAGPDSQCHQAENEGVGPRVEADDVPAAEIAGEVLLEAVDCRAQDVTAGQQQVSDRRFEVGQVGVEGGVMVFRHGEHRRRGAVVHAVPFLCALSLMVRLGIPALLRSQRSAEQ